MRRAGGSRALIDRELYLPRRGATTRTGARRLAYPATLGFATKPALAQKMIERAVAAGVPFRWFAADEVYGQNPGLRQWLEEQQIAYVMAVPCSQLIATAAGRSAPISSRPGSPRLAGRCCQLRRRAKGPRLYDWALIATAGKTTSCWSAGH